MWMLWIPHFKTVPEPPATDPSDNLLRKRDALPKNAIEISSYNPNTPWLHGLGRRRAGSNKQEGPEAEGGAVPKVNSNADVGLVEHREGQSKGHWVAKRSWLGSPPGAYGTGGNLIRSFANHLRETANAWGEHFLYYAVRHDEFALPPGPAAWRSDSRDGPSPLTPAPSPSGPYTSDQLMPAGGGEAKSDSCQTSRCVLMQDCYTRPCDL